MFGGIVAEIRGGLLAVSADGKGVAIAEGSEILAYDAADESPTWIATRPMPVFDLAADDQGYLAAQADGTLIGLSAQDGSERFSLGPFGDYPFLGVSVDGHWALAAKGVLRIGKGGELLRTIPLADPDVTAVAFAGEVPAVGYVDGRIRMFPSDGPAVTRQAFEPLYDLASDRAGVLVAADVHMARMPIEGKGKVLISFEEAITAVVRSPSGAMHAVRVGERYVSAHGKDGAEDLGMLRYKDRKVGGIAIDPQGNLWAACGQGHANKLDFARSSAIARTDPHPGRDKGSWLVWMNAHPVEEGRPQESVREEREVAAMKAMPVWQRVLLSVFAIVAVLGGWLGLIWLLGD